MSTISFIIVLIAGTAIGAGVGYVWRRMKLVWYCKVLLFVTLALCFIAIYLSWQGYVNAAGLFSSFATVTAVSEELLRRRRNKREETSSLPN